LDCCPHFGHKLIAACTLGHFYLGIHDKFHYANDGIVTLISLFLDFEMLDEEQEKEHINHFTAAQKSPREFSQSDTEFYEIQTLKHKKNRPLLQQPASQVEERKGKTLPEPPKKHTTTSKSHKKPLAKSTSSESSAEKPHPKKRRKTEITQLSDYDFEMLSSKSKSHNRKK